jgi:hypothetical protein
LLVGAIFAPTLNGVELGQATGQVIPGLDLGPSGCLSNTRFTKWLSFVSVSLDPRVRLTLAAILGDTICVLTIHKPITIIVDLILAISKNNALLTASA